MPIQSIVSLVLFLALVAALLVVVRRASRVLSESREDDAFRRALGELAGRADLSLGLVADRIDGVHRHLIPPEAIDGDLASASADVASLAEEAERLSGSIFQGAAKQAVMAALDRANRAIAQASHGCGILTSPAASGRHLEAEREIARGHLGVVHAREAIRRSVDDLKSTPGPHGERWYSRRR